MSSPNTCKDESLSNPTKVVRKKAERKKIAAHECYECLNYYRYLNLSEEEIKKRMQNCSRHRSNIRPTKEPDNFWDLDFPTDEEIERKKKMMVKKTDQKKVEYDKFEF